MKKQMKKKKQETFKFNELEKQDITFIGIFLYWVDKTHTHTDTDTRKSKNSRIKNDLLIGTQAKYMIEMISYDFECFKAI